MTARQKLYESLDPHTVGSRWCPCENCHDDRTRLLDAHRAEVLEEAAIALEGIHPAVYDDAGQRTADGVLRSAAHIRSMTTPKES